MNRGELDDLSTRGLLELYGGILDQLKSRGVVRSRNAPAGDLAETLAVIAYEGSLAPVSMKSWDVLAGDGRRIQVKCRVRSVARRGGVFSPFRSTDFEAGVFVVLNEDYSIASAIEVPVTGVVEIARSTPWVNGDRVTLSQDLRSVTGARDLTEKFMQALEAVDRASVTAPIVVPLSSPEPT